MVRDPLASAEDTDSVPGLGRFHLPRSSPSLGPTASEACAPRAWAPQQEEQPQ